MPSILFAYTAALAAGTSLFGWHLAELNTLQNASQEDLGLGAAQFGLASSPLAVGGPVGSGIATPGFGNFHGRDNWICPGCCASLSSRVSSIFGGRRKAEQAIREFIKIRGTPDVEEELASYVGQWGGQSDTTDDTQTVSGQDPFAVAEAGKHLFFTDIAPLCSWKEETYCGPPGQSDGIGNTDPGNENTPLLLGTSTPGAGNNVIGLVAFVTKREYRPGFVIVGGVMLAQQLTGINAVVFYGVSILQDLLPNSARYLNAGISGVNLFVTLGVSLLFDRVSHKNLLLASMLFMAISTGVLATSIFAGLATRSAIATLLFVMSFSIGLDPLPWIVAGRRIEPVAVGAAQSIALILNWMGTFLVSFLVPVLAQSAGMYTVFTVFTALSFIFLAWGVFFL
ncbi:hypothetical protein C7212DRAFT_361505 [Tuber magnatum]|uniref:MFS general substrate transporter n=1 Tax=Tuber magnatum TaxID=42249 RepID=A0A317T3P7_9PEZI|nr:hypothetical protein C7212DRAFT_361505 [Tuber magnatum]